MTCAQGPEWLGIIHDLNNALTAAAILVHHAREGTVSATVRADLDAAAASLEMACRLSRLLRMPDATVNHCDLYSLTRSVLSIVEATRPDAVEITLVAPTTPMRVCMPPLATSRMVLNLLGNALEAFSAGRAGRIEVRLRADDHLAYLDILDDGPGIDPALLETVVLPGVSARGPGRGQGLTIVRSAILSAGGSLRLLNREEGGLKVAVTIPLADQGTGIPPAPPLNGATDR